MEDTIAEGIKNRRQLPYAHRISSLIAMSRRLAHAAELDRSPIEFPVYQMLTFLNITFTKLSSLAMKPEMFVGNY